MVKHFDLPIEIVSCPIIREDDGLAMSSRNIHLSAEDRNHALVLSKALNYVKENYKSKPVAELVQEAKNMIASTEGVELDYFIIADKESLLPENNVQAGELVALVAAKVGHTRLIDNTLLG